MTWTIRRRLGDTCGAGRVTGRHAKDLPPVAGERTSGSRPGSLSRGMAAPALCVPGSRRRSPVGWRSVGRRTRKERPMPPPVAVPRRRTRARPARRHPRRRSPRHRTRRPGPVDSLAHVAALVRAAVPPMHPGGRPIVAGVAAAAGLVRVAHRPRRPRRRAGHRRHRRLLPQPAPRAAAAHGRRARRAADGTVALVSEVVPPPELDLPPGAGAARQRVPVGARRARPADPGRRAGASTSQYRHGRVPVGGPGQGQRGQRAQRAAAGDRRRRPGRASCRSRACWPGGSSATSRPGDEVAAGRDLRADPVRLAGRHLPAGGLDGHRRGRAAHDRRRDGARRLPGCQPGPPAPGVA